MELLNSCMSRGTREKKKNAFQFLILTARDYVRLKTL